MAFGSSIISKFSDDLMEIDPAYETMLDPNGIELDKFMSLACENAEPYAFESYDEDEWDEDWDDEDEDDDDEDWDEDDEDLDEDEEYDKECCENAITDAPPDVRRARYFKMLDSNPRFSKEKVAEMKANYDKAHPEGLKASGAKESAADYAKAHKMIYRSDTDVTEDVDTAYEENDYEDTALGKHAKYAADLRTGYKKLVEKNVTELNQFYGDAYAKYASNLHTSYHRANEGADFDLSDYDYPMDLDYALEMSMDDSECDEDEYQDYDTVFDAVENTKIDDIDASLNQCASALEGLLADLDDM